MYDVIVIHMFVFDMGPLFYICTLKTFNITMASTNNLSNICTFLVQLFQDIHVNNGLFFNFKWKFIFQ